MEAASRARLAHFLRWLEDAAYLGGLTEKERYAIADEYRATLPMIVAQDD